MELHLVAALLVAFVVGAIFYVLVVIRVINWVLASSKRVFFMFSFEAACAWFNTVFYEWKWYWIAISTFMAVLALKALRDWQVERNSARLEA